MTSPYTGIEFHGFVSSPSASPSNTIFSNGLHFDSNSDSSNPNSPLVNQMTFGGYIPYEMYQHSATRANFYHVQMSNKIPVEVTSSALDEKDRRKVQSDASKSGAKKETIPKMHSLQRKAQNCASQRAFRERKEKHVKGLERQLGELHKKHQDLLRSYSQQDDEVSRLNSRIAERSTELIAMRRYQDSSFSDLIISEDFDKFDAFFPTDMIYNTSYDRNSVGPAFEFDLNSFEDSL